MNIDISIVVPLYNEDESLPELAEWIEKVCAEHGYSYEVIMVDDGSTDNSWDVIQKLTASNKRASLDNIESKQLLIYVTLCFKLFPGLISTSRLL